MLLNTLYGIFGRKLESTEVLVVENKNIHNYTVTKNILMEIPLDENRVVLIVQTNSVPINTMHKLNITINTNVKDKPVIVNSNIAIASAITSYARIHMMDIKLHDSCYYTDTDSAFVDDLEPFKHLLGKEIGLFKDELGGLIIEEAVFLGIKQYGYWYNDINGNKVEKSVFAGVTRDSLSFNDIKRLQNGETLKLEATDRFYKSLLNLNIKIQSHNMHIIQNNNKTLINNIYYPITVNYKEIVSK